METVQEKLSEVVRRRLQDGEADLEQFPNGRIAGHVISSEFEGMTYEARRKRLRQVINEELTPEEIRQVSTLLTYTPLEWYVPLQDT